MVGKIENHILFQNSACPCPSIFSQSYQSRSTPYLSGWPRALWGRLSHLRVRPRKKKFSVRRALRYFLSPIRLFHMHMVVMSFEDNFNPLQLQLWSYKGRPRIEGAMTNFSSHWQRTDLWLSTGISFSAVQVRFFFPFLPRFLSFLRSPLLSPVMGSVARPFREETFPICSQGVSQNGPNSGQR